MIKKKWLLIKWCNFFVFITLRIYFLKLLFGGNVWGSGHSYCIWKVWFEFSVSSLRNYYINSTQISLDWIGTFKYGFGYFEFSILLFESLQSAITLTISIHLIVSSWNAYLSKVDKNWDHLVVHVIKFHIEPLEIELLSHRQILYE